MGTEIVGEVKREHIGGGISAIKPQSVVHCADNWFVWQGRIRTYGKVFVVSTDLKLFIGKGDG